MFDPRDGWQTRIVAALILLFLPLSILFACIYHAVKEGFFVDFLDQLKDIAKAVLTGRHP